MKVTDITNKDSDCMRHGSVKRKRGVEPKFDTLHSVICAVQNYVSVMPSILINEYGERLLKHSEACFKSKMEFEHYFPMILEIVLSPKLTRLSDKWMPIFCNRCLIKPCEFCDKWTDGSHCVMCYFNECKRSTHPTFREKLWKCSNLKKLSLTNVPHAVIEEKITGRMFNNFSHLTTLLLAPYHVKVSFHWVISHVI